jgi:hypothetical protein
VCVVAINQFKIIEKLKLTLERDENLAPEKSRKSAPINFINLGAPR